MTNPRTTRPAVDSELRIRWLAGAAAVAVLASAALDVVGWAAGVDWMTRWFPASPQMPPWTAVLQSGVAAAILLQLGSPSSRRVWVGRGLALSAGAVAAVFLVEYATHWSSGLSATLFPGAVRSLPDSWPGRRPSPTACSSLLLVSVAVTVIHLDRRWVRVAWAALLPAAVVMPLIALLAELFGVALLKGQVNPSTLTALLLVVAASFARPDRKPLAWLLARPDREQLIQIAAIMAGLPVLVGLARLLFLYLGVSSEKEHVLSLAVGTGIVGSATFYFFQRQQRLLDETMQRVEAEERYRLLAENAVDVIAHVHHGKIMWISPSVQEAYGDPVEHWIGRDFSPRIHPDDLETSRNTLRGATARWATARCRVRHADGGYRWVEFNARPYIDSEGNSQGVITAARIVDQQVEAEQQVITDKKRFEAVVANTPSAISVRDRGHRYTMVNDAFCELFGRTSPEQVIGRPEEQILPRDALELSRRAEARLLEGDSFTEEESITAGVEKLTVVTQRFPLRDYSGAITELVTIRTDVTLRKQAEREAAERIRWEECLRIAIAEGLLLVYSQPIVDVATRQTVAEELLVRLQVAESGEILPPAAFLPQCEKYGLTPMIDLYMLEHAVHLARAGREVSVNITGQTIGDSEAMNKVQASLGTAGRAVAGKIIFEITETMALTSPETARTFCRDMRSLGCRVALDDFGTGYGGLTEIRSLDLDVLKIDRSFVQNMLDEGRDERAVKIVVFAAREYGLTTVAEGVEQDAVLAKLAEMGADRAQGFLFSRPRPVAV